MGCGSACARRASCPSLARTGAATTTCAPASTGRCSTRRACSGIGGSASADDASHPSRGAAGGAIVAGVSGTTSWSTWAASSTPPTPVHDRCRLRRHRTASWPVSSTSGGRRLVSPHDHRSPREGIAHAEGSRRSPSGCCRGPRGCRTRASTRSSPTSCRAWPASSCPSSCRSPADRSRSTCASRRAAGRPERRRDRGVSVGTRRGARTGDARRARRPSGGDRRSGRSHVAWCRCSRSFPCMRPSRAGDRRRRCVRAGVHGLTIGRVAARARRAIRIGSGRGSAAVHGWLSGPARASASTLRAVFEVVDARCPTSRSSPWAASERDGRRRSVPRRRVGGAGGHGDARSIPRRRCGRPGHRRAT